MPTVPYLIVFIAGLGVAVYSMLQGVTPAPGAHKLDRGLLKSAPSTAGFAVIFGAVGYLCSAHTSLNPWVVLLIAGIGGGLSLSVTAPMLVRMSARMRSHPSEPEIGGQLAKVLKTISDDSPGEIEFELDGRPVRRRAVSIGGAALDPGQEVVIERIDQDLAYVEDWRTVEQRL